ncbi:MULTISPECIES: hypothetical protein [unclassified Luteococcus]|uniref:hypothetical protein n=1 Tax=unclassified Luteococcus TaxID=2639923 RepID=UPI00313DC351
MSQPPVVVSSGGEGATGYAAVAHAIAEGIHDPGWLEEYLAQIDAREDLADYRMMVVLALLLDGGDALPDVLREGIEHSVLGFRFWMDERGDDSMCHWSEGHQVVFSVCEYLAGQYFGERTFPNDGRTGRQKAERARRRLLEWLGNRFRHGFSEWLSGTFHAIKISALTLLIEHCQDQELTTRATMVLDLLMLDLAMHRFDGHFVASSGRSDALPKAYPEVSEIGPVVASAFSRNRPDFEPSRYTSIFLARRRYRIPQVVREIAFAQADHLITSSHGLDVSEASFEVSRQGLPGVTSRRDALLHLYWGMEAFTTPESIGITMEALERLHLDANSYLAPLAPFRKVPSRRVLSALVRSLNPITQGTALNRADVQTYRTPHYLLSSAQRHQPGSFGDQENIWVAALPGQIQLFSTHPGSTMLGSDARPATPSGWVGNGIRPDVAQVRNVLLALHDLRARRGYLEGQRHELSHLYFPAAKFDETTLSERIVAGRRDDSYFGAMALNRIEMPNESELVQRGLITGWAVMLADRSDFGSLAHFVDYLKRCRLEHLRDTLVWSTPDHEHRLTWGGPFVVDGQVLETDYARLRSDWTAIGRKPSVIEVTGRTGTLVLDWKLCSRTQGPGVPRP